MARNLDEVRVSISADDQSANSKQYSPFVIEQKKKFRLACLEGNKKQASDSSRKSKPIIQKVPYFGTKEDDQFISKFFKPRLLALGPLHHGEQRFERAEQRKLKLAALFALENGTTEDDLFDKIMAEIEYLKKCYDPEAIKDYEDEKLAWMFFVDGSAVLYTVHHYIRAEHEKLNIKTDLLAFAQLDLFLLENQIPYRVLQILIDSTEKPEEWEKSIAEFIEKNLVTNVDSDQHKTEIQKLDGDRNYAHLLHRLREQLLTGEEKQRKSSVIGRILLSGGNNRKRWKTFRSIKELKESGIHVVPSKTNNIKNIHFDCNVMGRLRMPRLLLDDSTAPKLMNLVALEMSRDFDNDFEVTTYLCFMDSLIDKAEDVKELRVTGMLHNYLGSDEEVADLFNRMSRDLVPDQNLYKEVNENILKYCNNPLTSTIAQGYYTYFSSSWSFLAFLGAILGLLFSAVQAYYSLPGTKPSDDNGTPPSH